MSLNILVPFLRPIANLFSDLTINEIRLLPTGAVFIERNGRIERIPGTISEDQREQAAANIAALIDRSLDPSRPTVDVRLDDGSRIAIIIPPASPLGINITIRRFPRGFTLNELVLQGSVAPFHARVLTNAALDRRNILISGATGTGKTTLLSAILRTIPQSDRLVLIEQPNEIQVDDPLTRDILPLECSDEFDARQALKATLRQSPDRIILGEVRDTEAYWFLEALNTGHAGSFTTIHANSADEALSRLARCVRAGKVDFPVDLVLEDIAAAIQFVAHLVKHPHRRLAELLSVDGLAQDRRSILTTAIPEQETPLALRHTA